MILPLVAVLAASTLEVPFVAQKKDTCGAAALAMVLRYWGDDATHDDVARTLLTPELHGIAGSRLAEFARGAIERAEANDRSEGIEQCVI